MNRFLTSIELGKLCDYAHANFPVEVHPDLSSHIQADIGGTPFELRVNFFSHPMAMVLSGRNWVIDFSIQNQLWTKHHDLWAPSLSAANDAVFDSVRVFGRQIDIIKEPTFFGDEDRFTSDLILFRMFEDVWMTA